MPAPYHVRLAVSQYGEQFRAELFTEDLGDTEGDLLLELPSSLIEWAPYLAQGGDIPPDAARQLGKDLFTALLGQPENAKKWAEVLTQASRNGQSIRLLIDATTEAVRDLPYGLLCEPHDDWYLFRSGKKLPVAFVRILRRCSPRPLHLPKRLRVLIAVAEPQSPDVPTFDAQLRLRMLTALHQDLDLYICGPDGPQRIDQLIADPATTEPHTFSQFTTTTPASLRKALAGDFDVFHLLAHGHGAGVLLCNPNGSPAEITASELGEWCSEGSVSLAFLQVCKAGQTGGRGGFGGVAQQLLNPRGGNLAAVVASTFPLDAEHSTEAAVKFYQRLAAGRPPEEALASDRAETDLCWAFLELWARPGALGGTQQRATFSFVSPYRGLSSFGEQEADLFFGRKAEVAELLQILRTDAAIAVVGDSGSGKTSLLQAGLVHAIRHVGLADSNKWRVVSLRPGYRPAQSLLAALTGVTAEPTLVALQAALRAAPQPLLVVMDQFEEVFTLARDKDEVHMLIAALADTIEQHRDQFRLIIGMRSEFLGQAAAIPQLSRLIRRPWVLRPPDDDDLKSIVAGPAEHCGYTFQSAVSDSNPAHAIPLLDRILADPLLESHSEETAAPLPLLQFALERLWLKAVEESVTEFSHAHFDKIGGMGMAVAQHAEAVYQASGTATQTGAEGRRIAEYIITALVSPQGTRQPRDRDVLQLETGNPEAARAVVDYLVGERLLTIRSDPEDNTKSLVDLSHEVLIQNWQRLRGWLAEDPQGKAMREAFRKAVEQYETGFAGVAARSRKALPGTDVAINYLAWINTSKPRLTPAQEQFAGALRRMIKDVKRRRQVIMGLLALLVLVASILAFRAMASEQLAKEQSAALMLEKGIQLGVQGQSREGLLSIAKSLELCPTEAIDLRRVIRTNLASWASAAKSLEQVRWLGAQALAASPNGEVALLFDDDAAIYLVETDTGNRVGVPLKTKWQNGLWARIVRSDADWLILTYDTQSASVWRASTGDLVGKKLELAKLFNGAGDFQIYLAALSPNGKTIAVSSTIGYVWLLNVSTGELDGDLPPMFHEGRVNSLAFTPDGLMLLTGCGLFPGVHPQDRKNSEPYLPADQVVGVVRLWSIASGEVIHHEWLSVPVTFVAVSPDPEGRYLAYGGRRFDVWDRKKMQKVASSVEMPDNGLWGAFDSNGSRLLVTQMSGKVELYPLSQSTQQPQAELGLSSQGWVADAGFGKDGNSIHTLNQDGTIRIWQMPSHSDVAQKYKHPESVLTVCFDPDSKRIASGCQNGSVYLWSTGDPLAHKIYEGRAARPGEYGYQPDKDLRPAITHAYVTSDGLRIVAQDLACRVMIWNIKPKKELLPPDGEDIVGAASDGLMVLVKKQDGTLYAKNLQTNWVGQPFQVPGGLINLPRESHDDTELLRVRRVAFSPDQSLVAVITGAGNVQIHRKDTGALVGAPLAHEVDGKSNVIRAVEFGSDGSRLMTQSDHARGLWLTSNGQIESLRPDSVGIQFSRFSPNGKLEVSATKFQMAQVWDVERKVMRRRAFLHDSRVWGASFDSQSQTVATASFDGSACLWDVSTGLPISRPLIHDRGVSEIVFSHDRKHVLTSSWDNHVRLWPVAEPVADDIGRITAWVETITGMRIGPSGAAEMLSAKQWDDTKKLLEELGGPF